MFVNNRIETHKKNLFWNESEKKILPIRMKSPEIGFEAKHTWDIPLRIASTHLAQNN